MHSQISPSPLSVSFRPLSLDEFQGQEHILGAGRLLQRAILSRRLSSLIMFGPPGCGKTTLGHIIARYFAAEVYYLNAAFTSVKEVKDIIKKANDSWKKESRQALIFIDEIHRFNKLQQETLLPVTEKANIILIGATIYNPHYYLISSLLSRSLVVEFKPLKDADIVTILKRALSDKKRGLGNYKIEISEEALNYLAVQSGGDVRKALDALEIGVRTTPANEAGTIKISLAVVKECIQKKTILYDRQDNQHYDTISAFIKSIRGSDPDSALYWLAKMLYGGEDPRFIARRLVILASEDIGNADPFALVLASSCFTAVERVGMPEAKIILAQGVAYLASTPKSNAAYLAINQAWEDIEQHRVLRVPENIKHQHKGYKYPHNYEGFIRQDYGVKKRYYFPKNIGEEAKIKEYLERLWEK